MRVRMLRQYEKSHRHTTLGVLTLIFAAGTTQHFPKTEAEQLIGKTENGKPAPIAEAYPEESVRVQMLRTMDIGGTRYAKGELVHFAIADAERLINAKDDEDKPSPAAEESPDETADHEQATMDEAIDAAIERKRVADEAAARREEMKKLLTAGSGTAAAVSVPTPTAEEE